MPDGVLENVPVVGAKRTFPRSFGRYILEKSLSRGGMGEVFLTIAKAVWKRCVIKTIRGDLTGDEEFIGRFADEAKIMMRIQHENIIRVFDAGKVGSDYYIAMEYVHGRDLGDVLDRAYERGEPMPTQLGLYVADKLLDGLEYAHKLTDEQGRHMGVVHRDISPQNVLIGFDGSVKLIDFGLARTDLLPARTQGALAVGKYGYMSPEQARHERIDGRADIYSTGVMLFEVFTGDRLVDEQDQATLWSRVLSPKHRRPSSVVSSLSKEIDDLVMTAVAVKTDERYRDANQMRKFVQAMRTKESNREDFVRYLRYLYPKVDFSAPSMPDFGDQFQAEGEKSMIIATSREGAMSVFGRGELPIEWTTQIDAAELQAAFQKYRVRDERSSRNHAREVTIDSINEHTDVPETAQVEATWVRGRNETPSSRVKKSAGDAAATQIADINSINAMGATAETKYTRTPQVADETHAAQPALGVVRVAQAFRDDEMTVMMDAPPRISMQKNAPSVSFLDEDTKDGDAPTRLSHAVPDVAAPTIVPSTRGRAIQEKKRGEGNTRDVNTGGAKERAPQKKDNTKAPQQEQRRAVAHRVTVGADGPSVQAPIKKNEDTLPPLGEPEYTEPERASRTLSNAVLPSVIIVAFAVIIVLIVLLIRM
jgi:serine/threonine protein kinase